MTAIYLGEMKFPLPPGSLTLEQAAGHKRVRLWELGEVTSPGAPEQMVFSFEGCFPAGSDPSPGESGEKLKEMLAGGPVRFVAAGVASPVSMQVTVEKLRLWEEAGDCGTVYYALTLREYRVPGVMMPSMTEKGSAPSVKPVRTETREQTVRYTVVKGDTLWAIAKRFLGSGSRYPELAEKNGIKNPHLIHPGQVLII